MKRFFIILGLAVGFFILKTFYQTGQFNPVENYNAGTVTTIYTNVAGPEDMEVDRPTGILYISSDNRRQRGVNDPGNGIYQLDLNADGEPALMATDYQGEFHPHGLSLYREDSTLYAFVVNHNAEGDFIEKFMVEGSQLRHLKSYSFANLCCPNDVVAVAADKFYVTNDHGTKKGFMRGMEDYLRIPFASLMYYNGSELIEVMEPFLYANGVNVSPDKKRLYLTATSEMTIHLYAINEDGTLTFLSTTDLGTGVDNIDVDEEGNLWIGAHPHLLDFLKHAKDSSNYSPSQVIKLTPKDEHHFEVEQIYMNDGSELSGCSVAVYYRNQVFVGGVFDRKIVRIQLPD